MTISEIKKLAVQAAADKNFIDLFLQLDPQLIISTTKDIKKIKNIDTFVIDLLSSLRKKEITKNESVFGIGAIIFTILSSLITLHFLLKLVIAIVYNRNFREYFNSLFGVIPWTFYVIFIIYVAFILLFRANSVYVSSNIIANDYAKSELFWGHSGISDLRMKDRDDNYYKLKRNPRGHKYKFTIYNNNGKKIGYSDNNFLYNLDGDIYNVITDDNVNKMPDGTLNISNLEDLLKINIDKKLKDQIEKHRNSIDSLIRQNINDNIKESSIFDYKSFCLNENIELSKKILKHLGLNWDDFLFKNSGYNQLKDTLEKNNNLGYLGQFTKIITSDLNPQEINKKSFELLDIYENKILPNKKILDKLKNITGKNIVDFVDIENLDDALDKLINWKSVNWFIGKLPPKQKKLIWEDGWFNKDVKENEQFLINSILNFEKYPDLMEVFIKKVSNIKTKSVFLKTLIDINKSSWDYYIWKNKLSKISGITITYDNESEKYIVVNVRDYMAIKKVAYMTNWCIFRQSNYFNSYVHKSDYFQYILYNFNEPQTSNNSVIGFTVTFDGEVKYSHDKADYSSELPDEFYEFQSSRIRFIKLKYLGNIDKFKRIRKIYKFLNWYDRSPFFIPDL